MNNKNLNHKIQLKAKIIEAFQDFYARYNKQMIYAFVLEVDEYFHIQYFIASTKANLFSETENPQQYLLEDHKWNFNLWKYRKKNNANPIKLNAEQNSSHTDDLIAKIFENVFPDQNHFEQLDLLMDAYQDAIIALTSTLNLDLSQILFLIHNPSHKELSPQYAQQLNVSSSLLFEFLAQIQISSSSPQRNPIKLKQEDKDLLIDLAQIVNFIEPYDSLSVAHQAYLLSLEPEFSELHTYIQDLVRNIAAMSNPTLALDKAEILERIKYFYKI